MKILLAGASGFVGTHLLSRLLEAGHEVVAIMRSAAVAVPEGAQAFCADLRRSGEIDFPAADVFIHLAQANVRFPEGAGDLFAVNCASALHMMLAGIKHGARQMIYASTGNVYGLRAEPASEDDALLGGGFYAESKVAAERLLGELRGQIPLDVLRVFSPYGPGQQSFRLIPDIVRRVREGLPVTVRSNGMPILSPLWVEDAVEGILRRLGHGDSLTFNMAGDEIVTVREIALCAGQLLGIEPNFTTAVDQMTGGIGARNERFRTILGRKTLCLAEGLRRYVEWDAEQKK